ncbi:MAG TPA: hypothetical protein VMT16_02570 [Thermoanaerobaculia bacterium]|nr:hypothetical protein [Thermoanaerobaculia bacterium]
MIRLLVVLGWLGVLLLLAAGASGYALEGDGQAFLLHLALALGAGSVLLFVHLCLLLYFPGVGRVVDHAVRHHQLPREWSRRHRSLRRRGVLWAAAAALPVAALFASGLPTYTARWEPWVHHGLFLLTAAVEVAALLRLRVHVARSEALFRDLDGQLPGS